MGSLRRSRDGRERLDDRTVRHLARRGLQHATAIPCRLAALAAGGLDASRQNCPIISRFSMSRLAFVWDSTGRPVWHSGAGPPSAAPSASASVDPRASRSPSSALCPGRRVGRRCRRTTPRRRMLSRCTRYQREARLTRRNRPGRRNRVRFSGRIGARALRPGVHRATVSATDATGNASRRERTTFRVLER